MHPSEKCQKVITLVTLCNLPLPKARNANVDHRSYRAIQTEHTLQS
jgi:hypothetical protein